MSSDHSANQIHNPDEGSWFDATCAECGVKGAHTRSCSFRKIEEEAKRALEAQKTVDQAASNQSTSETVRNADTSRTSQH
ncbi:hypothetical protein FRC19_000764 [Serendipita sp. 401]|nr:hypothetical protein FRC18_006482 [Serendipita sp. 400]KAG8827755.1 hypothetical protein FRC19_000764 [Serendipita sp. 401]